MSENENALAKWEGFVGKTVTKLVAGLPMSVSSADLGRATSRLKIAFSQQAVGRAIFQCTPNSIATCIAMSAVSGLFPGGHNPDVDLIPRKDKHQGDALILNWQISYRGYIRLCRRNPGWDITPRVVLHGDVFDVTEGSFPELIHKPLMRKGNQIFSKPDEVWDAMEFFYAIIDRPGGLPPRFEWLDKGQIEARRACARDQSFWAKWPAEKALATVCRYAGQREAYPTDDPVRYAMKLDLEENSTGSEALPAAVQTESAGRSRSDSPVGMKALGESLGGAAIDITPQKEAEPVERAAEQSQERPAKRQQEEPTDDSSYLSDEQLDQLIGARVKAKVSEGALQQELGVEFIPDLKAREGESNEALFIRVMNAVDKLRRESTDGKR